MLNESQEIRLFGLRYRTILLLLLGLAMAIILMMAVTVPSVPAPRVDTGAMEEILGRFHNTWIRLLVLSSILGFVLTAVLLTVFSYFSTRQRLSRIRTTAKAILESLAGGVLTMDIKGNITIINRAASQILELPSQAPYPDLESLSSRHPRLAQVIRQSLSENDYVQDDDMAFVNSAGVQLVLRTTVSAQLDETGRKVGLVVLVKDVSRIVAMEKELRRKDRLAAAGTLAAGVAHEIRNPLSAIELNLRLLNDDVKAVGLRAADVDEYFDVLFAETQRLNRITSSFLQLSRPESLKKARLPIQRPARRVLRLLESEAQSRKINFEVSMQVEELEVLGDETKLEQVCLNLLINSMQAMPDGGTIRVSASSMRVDDRCFVDLAVKDEGAGIPADIMPRLFDPYFTTRPDGTGLGLAVADRIVTDHGGSILTTSDLGIGTTMTVRLPAASPASEQECGQ
jgi:signal transduction histidine kinase